MGTGYTRNDTSNNIADGNVIDAADLDGEFDSIQAAFNSTTGHTHDGTAAEGAPITVTGPAQEYVSTATELRAKTDNTYDLGSSTVKWKNAYIGGNITVGGTVDGRDVAADGTKLDGIESGATADQTAAEIRALVEAATDSNVFTDADHSKLNGIEAGATADQTASEILTAIKTVDGPASGLDADTLDGKQLATIESEYQSYATSAATTAVANVIDAAPTTLDTLNELAAALGDDPNFATTVTNSIATKLALSGGTMTGAITFAAGQLFDGRDVSADGAVIDSLGTAATQDVGTSAGNVVQLDGSARLPAVDGSQLTGIEGVPSGVITLWSGSVASIPSGWVLCDGLNSTPDLRDRFIVGAGNTYAVGATGGADSVTLSEAQIPGHTHSVSGNTSNTGAHTHTLSGNTSNTGAHTHTVSGNTSNSGNHTHTGSTSNTGSHTHNAKGGGSASAANNAIFRDFPFGNASLTYNTNNALSAAGAHSHNLTIDGGGDHSHTLSGTADSGGAHSHTLSGNAASAGSHSHTISGTAASTGGGGSHENRPPYYALAYIMKT